MKHWLPRFTVLAAVLTAILLSSVPAGAAGMNIGWSSSTAINDCPSSASATATKSFACGSNAGAEVVIGSLIAPAGLVKVVGETVIVDFQETSAPISDWWNFNTDVSNLGCRGTPSSSVNLSMNFDPLLDDGICGDLWNQNAASGFSFQPNLPASGSGHLSLVGAIASSLGGPMAAGTEWYSFRMVIDNRHTVAGTLPVCTGCTDGVCIAFNYLQVNNEANSGGTDATLNTADPSGRQMVTWNIASNPPCTGVPVKRTSWGQVKSLYR